MISIQIKKLTKRFGPIVALQSWTHDPSRGVVFPPRAERVRQDDVCAVCGFRTRTKEKSGSVKKSDEMPPYRRNAGMCFKAMHSGRT